MATTMSITRNLTFASTLTDYVSDVLSNSIYWLSKHVHLYRYGERWVDLALSVARALVIAVRVVRVDSRPPLSREKYPTFTLAR